MKKVLVLLVMFVGLTSFSQEKEIVEAVKESPTFMGVIQPYVVELLGSVETGVEFMVTEVPIVIKQYLYFEATRLWLMILLGISISTLIRGVVSNFLLIKSEEKPKGLTAKSYIGYKPMGLNRWLKIDTDDDGSLTFEEVMYPLSKMLLILIGCAIILVNILDAIKVTFFPKLFLVEKFIHLVV